MMKSLVACTLLLALVPLSQAQLQFTTTGEWGYSLGYGYEPTKSSLWTTKPGTTATFTPFLATAGSYRVWFYVVRIPQYELNENAAKFDIRHNGQVDTRMLDTTVGAAPGYWTDLGTYAFAGGPNESVTMTKSNFYSIFRAVAMKFDRLGANQQVLDTTWITDLMPYDPVALGAIRPTITDMPGHWAKEAATNVVAKGWMSAVGGKFFPNGAVTKAGFAKSLSKVISKPFSSPDGPITPSEMLYFTVSAAKLAGKNLNFASPLTGATADVAKRLQLTTGPNDPAVQGATGTRAQAAALLDRLHGSVMQSQAPATWSVGFHDEFDAATLNEAIWFVYDNVVGEYPAINARLRSNVEQRGDGLLRLVNRKEPVLNRQWTAGMLDTRGYTQRYGYFEARIKVAPASGLNNGFWMRNKVPLVDPRHFEIDNNEAYFPNSIGTTLHQDGLPTNQLRQPVAFDMSIEYHTFSVLWDESSIVYYVDGREVDRKSHVKAIEPAVMILSSSIMGWAGPVTDRINGTVMLVDWVRAYVKP